jgi:hypothetical protein
MSPFSSRVYDGEFVRGRESDSSFSSLDPDCVIKMQKVCLAYERILVLAFEIYTDLVNKKWTDFAALIDSSSFCITLWPQ